MTFFITFQLFYKPENHIGKSMLEKNFYLFLFLFLRFLKNKKTHPINVVFLFFKNIFF
jgi:hypothetical protein